MPEPVQNRSPRKRRGAAPPPLSAEAFDISRQLIELIRVAYATRSADGPAATPPGSTPDAAAPELSAHAVRAAVHVYQHGDLTIGDLARGLGISYGWASRVVTELEATGHVERRADPDDRRVVHVALTPAAAETVERAYRWRGDAVERALAGLDGDGKRAVAIFLSEVTRELAEAGRDRQARG